jgi:release factor glutamine methyltransferase
VLTIGEVLRRSRDFLAERGSASPRLDAELLMAHALGIERLGLYTDSERPLTPPELARCRELIGRRARREPVAYHTGERAFRRLRLRVGPGVLVPRPETEVLVEWALEVLAPGAAVLDWGTGSGAIAVALATEGDGLHVTAIDRSPEALAVAEANAAAAGAAVELVRSDGFAELAGRAYDAVVANPPYLSDADLAGAPPELGFEPREALVAGPTGLEAIAAIVRDAPAHLVPGGWLLMEVGAGQAPAVVAMLRDAGAREASSRDDLAGIARVVGGRFG